MKRAPTAKAGATPRAANRPAPGIDVEAATKVVLTSLEDDKAEEILAIDIRGKSSFADMLVIASGRSARHVGALGDHVMRQLKEAGVKDVRIEGMPECNWVIVDAGCVIVHLFQPEARDFYKLEKMWSGDRPVELVQDLMGSPGNASDRVN